MNRNPNRKKKWIACAAALALLLSLTVCLPGA